MSGLVEVIKQLSRPLKPRVTDVPPRLQTLDGIRAVAFDIYGTLIISSSGDVGTDQASPQAVAMREALAAVGIDWDGNPHDAAELLRERIERNQQRARLAGVEYPEVEIRNIWSETLKAAGIAHALDAAKRDQLAIEFESRANPTWPMPGALDVLNQLCDARFPLGIVSNAQFYTPLVMEALFDATPEQLGFAPELQIYSYRHARAKPGTILYEKSAAAFAKQGIDPHEVLYIGNDLLKDVMPAGRVGFRTALFAGDRRSLRMHDGDARVDGVKPDLMITEMSQVMTCIPK